MNNHSPHHTTPAAPSTVSRFLDRKLSHYTKLHAAVAKTRATKNALILKQQAQMGKVKASLQTLSKLPKKSQDKR